MPTEIHTLDLNFQNTSQLIAVFLAPCPEGGFVLFESGPASTIDSLDAEIRRVGFEPRDLRAVFPTHVHLDHAAGCGTLARRSGAKVFVHPSGSNHLVNPGEKLIPSAERLYGEMMIPLWGKVESVPADRVHEVGDGEAVEVGGLEIIAHHTPGHAVHHVTWQVGATLVTGDVGGIRFPGATHVLPPMPPPDIDVEAWRESIRLMLDLGPERLLVTHFGAFDAPQRHLEELDDRLVRWRDIAMRHHREGEPGPALAKEITALEDEAMRAARVPAGDVRRYLALCPMDANTAGLQRYCRIRTAGEA